VIFDMDGTLVDSPLDFDAMRREIGCPPNRGLLEHIAAAPACGRSDRAA
jgi:beta-phosphoglucomutase-like phosphatase (HAD superfamily)